MTPAFRITPRAAQHLRHIARHTLETWGRAQRDSYLKALDQRFAWLAQSPEHVRARPDVKEGYYSYVQGSHVIFYLIRNGGIDIIGIPTQTHGCGELFHGIGPCCPAAGLAGRAKWGSLDRRTRV